jgi:hypothetical protein
MSPVPLSRRQAGRPPIPGRIKRYDRRAAAIIRLRANDGVLGPGLGLAPRRKKEGRVQWPYVTADRPPSTATSTTTQSGFGDGRAVGHFAFNAEGPVGRTFITPQADQSGRVMPVRFGGAGIRTRRLRGLTVTGSPPGQTIRGDLANPLALVWAGERGQAGTGLIPRGRTW